MNHSVSSNQSMCKYWENKTNLALNASFEETLSALSEGEVPVVCVFVYKNAIITTARNQINATKNAPRHAEFVSIDQTLYN
uniref:Uncharacterized protein n=1 Tax=Glossina morsitans morsitans TaxID=37546 RepID=A0A1B0G869_GLOMM